MHQAPSAERASHVVNECWSVAQTRGPSAARDTLWHAVLRDPLLLGSRPVLGAVRRLCAPQVLGRRFVSAQPEGPVAPDAQVCIERLISDSPKLHSINQNDAQWLTEHGLPTQAGPMNWAVPPQVIRYIAANVTAEHLTIETGAGHSTVAFAALAKHHTCITIDEYCVDATRKYLDELGISRNKVTFIVESSDTALPRLGLTDKLDFAYIDGQHGYPFAALDWHYIDPYMKVGGIVGFDNAEIPAVRNHCEFLELNKTYRLVENISERALGTYCAYFYTKLADQNREAGSQQYNYRRVAGMFPQEPATWPWS
jgi:predicted O-methyltransferase YrrM